MSPLQFWLNGLTDDDYYLWRLSRHSQAFSLLLRPQHLTPTGPQHRKWQTLPNPAFGLASSQTTKTHQSWLGWQKQLSSLWWWAHLLAKDKLVMGRGATHPDSFISLRPFFLPVQISMRMKHIYGIACMYWANSEREKDCLYWDVNWSLLIMHVVASRSNCKILPRHTRGLTGIGIGTWEAMKRHDVIRHQRAVKSLYSN